MGILTGLIAINKELFQTLKNKNKFEEFIDLYEGWKDRKEASFELKLDLDKLRRKGLDKSYYDLNSMFLGYGDFFSENRYLLRRYNEKLQHKSIDAEYISPQNIVYLLDKFRLLVESTFDHIIETNKEFNLLDLSEYGNHSILKLEEIDEVFKELNKLAYKYLDSLDDPDDWWCDDDPMSEQIDYLGHYSKIFIKFLTESVYQEIDNKIELKYEAVVICSS